MTFISDAAFDLAAMDSSGRMAYFAYGANMNTRGLERRVEGSVHLLGTAILQNHEMQFSKSYSKESPIGYASIHSREGVDVEGVLFLLSAEQIRDLDNYESYPEEYGRRFVEVVCRETKERITAIAYFAQPETVRLNLVPTKSYLEGIVEGAIEHKLSRDVIDRLKNTPYFDN